MPPDKPLSKQVVWQRKQVAAGRCRNCGKDRMSYRFLCNECQRKKREKEREKMNLLPWEPGGRGRKPKS